VARRYLLSILALCGLALPNNPAYGCRYNVREVGFIDIGIEPYRLIVCLPGDTPTQEQAALQDAVDAALLDTNVRFEPVAAGAEANQPATQFFAAHDLDRLPAVVLVSPDGQSRPVALPAGGQSLGESVCEALSDVLQSPTRREILEKAADNYGVVLLIEGPEPQRNAAARAAVSTAITRVGGQLENLPKPIARPPTLVVLDRPSLAREETLLWALGFKPQDINEPCAAVFYGRGRWIGPLFKGDLLTADALTELLFVIGADCECGLDHRMLQGTMLPARWDETLRAKTVESLGFDPESPMVRMEMVSIVRRGMGGFDYPGVPLGYEEIQVGADVPEGGEPAPRDSERTSMPVAMNPQSAIRNPQFEDSGLTVRVLAVSLGGISVLTAAASVVIVLRARRKP
jgi:hypothetical protein